MIWKRLKKPNKEEIAKKQDELATVPLEKGDMAAMLLSAFLTIFLPAVIFLCVLVFFCMFLFGAFS